MTPRGPLGPLSSGRPREKGGRAVGSHFLYPVSAGGVGRDGSAGSGVRWSGSSPDCVVLDRAAVCLGELFPCGRGIRMISLITLLGPGDRIMHVRNLAPCVALGQHSGRAYWSVLGDWVGGLGVSSRQSPHAWPSVGTEVGAHDVRKNMSSYLRMCFCLYRLLAVLRLESYSKSNEKVLNQRLL